VCRFEWCQYNKSYNCTAGQKERKRCQYCKAVDERDLFREAVSELISPALWIIEYSSLGKGFKEDLRASVDKIGALIEDTTLALDGISRRKHFLENIIQSLLYCMDNMKTPRVTRMAQHVRKCLDEDAGSC